MDSNGTFIAAHIFFVLPLVIYIFLNIYKIDKSTFLLDKKTFKLRIFRFMFLTYRKPKDNRIPVKIFVYEMICMVLFSIMTAGMIVSLYFPFKTKVYVILINIFIILLYGIYIVRLKNKYK